MWCQEFLQILQVLPFFFCISKFFQAFCIKLKKGWILHRKNWGSKTNTRNNFACAKLLKIETGWVYYYHPVFLYQKNFYLNQPNRISDRAKKIAHRSDCAFKEVIRYVAQCGCFQLVLLVLLLLFFFHWSAAPLSSCNSAFIFFKIIRKSCRFFNFLPWFINKK